MRYASKTLTLWAMETVVWWVLLVGLWVLTLSSVSVAEVVVAASCALPCAALATAGRQVSGARWRPAVAWLRWFAVLPVAVCTDTWRLFVATPRLIRGTGSWRHIELPDDPSAARAAARRAAAVLTVSATPGTLVADTPPEKPMLVHVLVSGRPRLDDRVAR